MTPEQVELVKATIGALADHPMFGDLQAQRQKLTDELAGMVELLGDLSSLDERAAELGRRHRGYGVRAGHYPVARAVMADTLAEVLGDAFGSEEREAWDRATMLITELMQAG